MRNELAKQILAKLEKLPDVALQGGLAYLGYKATGHWTGALTAMTALKLAQAPNPISPFAGLAVLAALGLTAYVDKDGNVDPPVIETPGPFLFPTEGEVIVTTPANCLALGGTILPRFTPGGLIQCELPVPPPELPPSVPPPSDEDIKPPWWILRPGP